jgi:hypothetical protein
MNYRKIRRVALLTTTLLTSTCLSAIGGEVNTSRLMSATPDDDPGPRYNWESPEHAFTRCVAERAARAVLERTTVYKVTDGKVSVELREIGHAEITRYNADTSSLLEYGDRINIDWMPMATVPRNGTILLLYC